MGRGAGLQRPKAERGQGFGEPEFLRNRWFFRGSCWPRWQQLPRVHHMGVVVFQSADPSVPLWGWGPLLMADTEAG